METYGDQMIADGLWTREHCEKLRAEIVQEIIKSQTIGDHKNTQLQCERFINCFPSSGLSPIEKAIQTVFKRTWYEAKKAQEI